MGAAVRVQCHASIALPDSLSQVIPHGTSMRETIRRLSSAIACLGRSTFSGFLRSKPLEPLDMNDPLDLGRLGERAAYRFLKKRGYQIVARNFRTPRGEIDLVGWDRDILCFVEVKTRASTERGRPEEAVTAFKQEQILNTAIDYLQHTYLRNVNHRFDIVSVQVDSSGAPVCRLIKRAFGSRSN
jgi:putative endonuclease